MTEWIISDTHFGHEKIIGYCQRPFASVREMNDHMIGQWNNTVRPDDIVYHVGDVGFGGGASKLRDIVPQLNGYKVLIRGNHDSGPESMRRVGFDFVCDELVLNRLGARVVLKHAVMDGLDDCVVVHGHIHNSPSLFPKHYFNASVEVNSYRPVSLDAVVKKILKGKN